MNHHPTDTASGESALRPPQPPLILGYSLMLGLAYALAWLGFTAVRGQDGRMPITDWMDPMLAGATLAVALLAIVSLIALWGELPATRIRTAAAVALVVSEWTYIAGEILSNTITIGEPPRDIGSLLEITSGVLAVLGVITLALPLAAKARAQHRPATTAITIVAIVLAAGMGWWFAHPIDQGTPGAPDCVPGNLLYNVTHGTTC